MTFRKLATRTVGLLVVVTVLGGMSSVASACPSCQAALANDASQANLARGIYYSILFMMSMPFAIVGTFGALFYRAVKREQRRISQSHDRDASPDERD